MTLFHLSRRTPADLGDAEVLKARRAAFAAAIEIMAEDGDQERSTRGNRMTRIVEKLKVHAPWMDEAAQLFGIAQAAHFLTDPAYFTVYVPVNPLSDDLWLTYMLRDRAMSDSALAFQVARGTPGFRGDPPVDEVASARKRLGLDPSERAGENEDTLRILQGGDGSVRASDFLGDEEWLRERVVVRDMSDGEIARELEGVGAPCDRSTVRGYRNQMKLQRPSVARGQKD